MPILGRGVGTLPISELCVADRTMVLARKSVGPFTLPCSINVCLRSIKVSFIAITSLNHSGSGLRCLNGSHPPQNIFVYILVNRCIVIHTCINLTVTCMFALLFCENVYLLYFYTHYYILGVINKLLVLLLFIDKTFFATQNYNTSEITIMWPSSLHCCFLGYYLHTGMYKNHLIFIFAQVIFDVVM